jgi:phosphomevalonate kinase
MSRIVTSAPGKLVLSGEYAVLAGAPALVLAVDRRVTCELGARAEPGWRFRSTGFAATSNHTLPALLGEDDLEAGDPARICQAVLRTLLRHDLSVSRLPMGLEVRLDSHVFYHAGAKLGLGSSAALCVALTRGLLDLAQSQADTLPIALTAHRALQDGRGSGLDVAAACLGGLVSFHRTVEPDLPTALRRELPREIHLGFFWSGSSTSTTGQLERFERWAGTHRPPALAALVEAAVEVTLALPDADDFMRQLRAYSQRLRAMDEASGIGIYGDSHLALVELAESCDVIYKPSGAGGGDVGIAIATSAAAIEALAQRARAMDIATLALGMEQHGIEVSRK